MNVPNFIKPLKMWFWKIQSECLILTVLLPELNPSVLLIRGLNFFLLIILKHWLLFTFWYNVSVGITVQYSKPIFCFLWVLTPYLFPGNIYLCQEVSELLRVAHFSQIKKFWVDQPVLHNIWYADVKKVKNFYFDACFPFPLTDQSFST